MPVRIAVLTDFHFRPDGPPDIPARRGEIADVLLLRAVHRLNRFTRPDVALVAGDLLDNARGPGAEEALKKLRGILDLLKCPWVAIPGNHDGDPEAFYRVFDRPPEILVAGGVGFVSFVDPETPGFNARRLPEDLDRMARAREAFAGPLVALQHVPVLPPGKSDCPYNYTNAAEVLEAMRRHGFALAVSGHYHAGIAPLRTKDGIGLLSVPALCEAPFAFWELELEAEELPEIDRRPPKGLEAPLELNLGTKAGPALELAGGVRLRARKHFLQMPPRLNLVDCHVHSQFAYCSENMEIGRAMALGRDFGLAGLGFSEHSDQLYFAHSDLRAAATAPDWTAIARPEHNRVEAYLAALEAAGCPAESVGFEVEATHAGGQLIRPADAARARFLIGAIHSLPERSNQPPSRAKMAEEFLAVNRDFLKTGVRALAHPFRIFRRCGLKRPRALFEPMAALLREHGVAAEINFHTNEPSPEFVKLCLESGVKFVLGSDSHNLYEIGEFAPHLALLRLCGFDGDLRDILIDPRKG